MAESETVIIPRQDFEKIIELLKQQKHYVAKVPENGGANGVIGQIDELLASLGRN